MSMKTSKLYPKCFGEIPHGWNEKRLKYAANVVVEKPHNSKREVPYIGLEHVESGTGRLLQLDESFDEESSAIMCRTGDVLFGKLRPYLAKCFLAEREFRCSSEFLVFRSSSYNQNYLKYLLMTKEFIDLVNSSTYGAKMPRASWDFIGNIIVPIPPIDVQKKIANYLDQQTAKLDQIIEKKKRLIELLQEKRQVIITQAVTKGLDPNVPMKDSGTEWLGEVPAHWEVCKLNFRYSIELGKMLDEKRIRGKSLVRYLRNQDVQWGYINTEDLPEMDIEISERDRYTVKNGDLLVCEGGDIGRAAIWRGNDNEIGYQKALHRVRPRVNERDTPEFFYFVLVAAKHRGVFNETDNKATIPHLTGEKFRQYRFAFPPIEEQREIVDYLAHIESQYRILKSKLERSTILLDQYRQALITAAVTGQIDVREKMTVSAETISAGKE